MPNWITSHVALWQRRLQRLRPPAQRALPFVVTVLATLIVLWIYDLLTPPPTQLTISEVGTAVVDAMASATPEPAYSALVYQYIRPSIVFIRVENADPEGEADKTGEDNGSENAPSTDGASESAPGPGAGAPSAEGSTDVGSAEEGQGEEGQGEEGQGEEGLDEGSTPEPSRPSGGLGSGVVINANGDILTSLHVVENATKIEVIFADGTESEAHIINAVPEKDIAVLSASQLPELLVPATLGNPNAMHVGDEAYVVGHPLGLYGSMSSGVISGFDRSFRPPDGGERLEGLIQIDAAVNPGNSGGPLLNRYGQVIGIVAGLANPTDNNFFIGIGFAVPIDVAGGAAGLPPY